MGQESTHEDMQSEREGDYDDKLRRCSDEATTTSGEASRCIFFLQVTASQPARLLNQSDLPAKPSGAQLGQSGHAQ